MPIIRGKKANTQANDLRKDELLEKIKMAEATVTVKTSPVFIISSDDSDDEDEEMRQNSLKCYKRIIDQTMDLPLQKMILTDIGCDIFDELCLRIDVNQKYAELLPQWKDVAHQLEIDQLMTKWVEVCVRPKEGLARAMLEIYMKDGGTIGEVLEALLKLECLNILELLRPKMEKYIKLRDSNELVPMMNMFSHHENFYSVLKTLVLALGPNDPCQDLHKFSNGIKQQNSILVQTRAELSNTEPCINMMKDMSHYQSDLHLNVTKSKWFEFENEKKVANINSTNMTEKITCKVLLLFSSDGIPSSDLVVNISETMIQDSCQLEVFRLNEATLWYEVLSNPEACCMKWVSEVDYIMPILTPKYLQEIHGVNNTLEETAGLLPTSPILNKYLYNLARSQYAQNGCKNYKVRPMIPPLFLGQIRNSNAVKGDTLFANTWKLLKEDLIISRFRSLMNECVKKKSTV